MPCVECSIHTVPTSQIRKIEILADQGDGEILLMDRLIGFGVLGD
jgi:hypothetical protein